jgi:hypothetical protein
MNFRIVDGGADNGMPLLKYIQDNKIKGLVSLHSDEGFIAWVTLEPEELTRLCLSVRYTKAEVYHGEIRVDTCR